MNKLLCCVSALLLTATSAAAQHRLHFITQHGYFVGAGTETGLPDLVPNSDLAIKALTTSARYPRPKEISVWIVDEQGNASEPTTIQQGATTGVFTIPASLMKGGEVYIKGDFIEKDTPAADSDMQLVFGDEFDGEEHSQPNDALWKRADHNNNSAWNRFVSTSDKVVYVEDGNLVTRCIPCADEDRESNKNTIEPYNYRDWMSGAVDTRTKFSFKYGYVDVRAKTNPFSGSFPAIWMLPDDQSAGWPQYGEIDIWEMVNTNNAAHGTIHAQRESQYTKNTPCNYDGLWHVYSFRWTEKYMNWLIDGKSYSILQKSSYNASQLAQGYWPFDKEYYLILNQSVGAGGWAANPVAGHEYETRFDFVRIFQSREMNPLVGIEDVEQTPTAARQRGIFDLSGRLYTNEAPLKAGLYIKDGKKVMVK